MQVAPIENIPKQPAQHFDKPDFFQVVRLLCDCVQSTNMSMLFLISCYIVSLILIGWHRQQSWGAWTNFVD